MVGLEEGAHVVARPLVGFVDLNPVADQLEGVDHEGDPVQQILPAGLLGHEAVELLLVPAGNHVPGLRVPLVAVVDRVQPLVLHVPAECGKHHAHVDPGRGDSADELFLLGCDFEDGLVRLVNVV